MHFFTSEVYHICLVPIYNIFISSFSYSIGSSIGVDAAEGLLYHNSDDGENRFVQCSVGDTIKVSIVPLGREGTVNVEFYHNNILITTETTDVPEEGLYAVVALASPREAVIISPPQREEVESFEALYETKSPYITHEGDGICSYKSPRSPSFHSDPHEPPPLYVGTLRSIKPLEAGESFEVKLLDKGAEGAIAVGICPSDYPIDSMPGWNEGSVAYHADISSILDGMEKRDNVAIWKEGDTLSVSLEPVDGSTKEFRVLFRKNGDIFWKDKMWNPSTGLHWCLGLMSSKEKVQIILPRQVITLDAQSHKFEDIWQLTSPSVEYTKDGICVFVGHHDSPGVIRSRKPINPLSKNPFFDTKIINFGKECEIVIGVCSDDYSLVQLPGWRPKSIGFHCYTGNLYQNSELPQQTGSICSEGDVIRCTVSPVDKSDKRVAITFHRNGELVAKALDWTPPHGFHAQLGMTSESEAIQIACPLTTPSTLKKGLAGIDSDLTRPVKKSKHRTAPILFNPEQVERISTNETDNPYVYVKPVSPLIHDTSASGTRTVGISPLAGEKRRESYPKETPKESFRKYHQTSEPGLGSSGLPPPELFKSQVSTHSSHSSVLSTPSTSSLPTTPSSISPLPLTPHRHKQLISTPNDPVIEVPPPPSFLLEPLREEGEVHVIEELPKATNHLFKTLQGVSYFPDSTILTVSSDLPDGSYAYAVRRQALTEKMKYFEVDILPGSSRGIAVGVSSGPLYSNRLLGTYPHSLSYDTSTGKLYTGTPEHHSEPGVLFNEGDTIGCCLSVFSDLSCRPGDDKNAFSPSEVRVEFYKNASLIVQVKLPLPPTSLSPSLCFSGHQSNVKIVWKYKMKPEDYFESHPVPEGYRNFPQPPVPPTPSGWHVIKNQKCELLLEGNVCRLSLSPDAGARDKELLIQHHLPFTLSDVYFELELSAPSSTYSVVSLGAVPRTNGSPLIPGEKGGGVGFLPLTGLIMRNGEIVSYIEDDIVSVASSSRGNLKLGIGMEIDEVKFSTSRSVLLFFTINSQEVSKLVFTVPQGGLFPTLSIQSKSSHLPLIDRTLCRLFFPQPWPCNNVLKAPLAIARISQGFAEHSPNFVYYKDQLNASINSSVKGIQACYALSPRRPYFEVSVLQSKDYKISVGLAPLLHPLHSHVGLSQHSIGYLIDKSGVFQIGLKISETPTYNHTGVKIGCGALFPEDGSMGSAEIFFVINGVLVLRQFVQIPPSGLFPSVGISSDSLITFMFNLPLPFSGMIYSSQWLVLENVLATGNFVQPISHAHMGIAQLSHCVTLDRTVFFKASFRTSPFDSGKVLVGFSNGTDSPFSPKVSVSNSSYFMELSSGTIIIIQMGQRQSAECQIPKGSSYVGCGILPIQNSNSSLLFFTADHTIIYSRTINIYQTEPLHPTLCMVGSMGKIQVQSCPLWPSFSLIGFGWGRFSNVQYAQGAISGSSSIKNEFGFIQASSPLIPSHSYFEVEIIKRDPKKSIAVGLASRQYNTSHWVGLKPESIAYHCDDGKLYKANTMGMTFGAKLFEGDVIGCGIQFSSESASLLPGNRLEVYYTINGHRLPKTELMTIPNGGLFPTICLESFSETVCVYLRPERPLGLNRLGKMWSRGYCISQTGHILQHSFQVKSQKYISSFPEGFCQGSKPLTQIHSYFEIEILSLGEKSNLSIGIAPLQPMDSRKIVTPSVMFTAAGQVVSFDGSRTTVTPTRQKVEVGDRIGCRFKIADKYMNVEFSRNGIKVIFANIPAGICNQALHPTLVFTTPEDSVVPLLSSIPSPSNLPVQQVGWLRSERLRIKGCIIEYNGLGPEVSRSVGVVQTNQPLTLRYPYFEIELLNTGQSCMIGIGAAALDYPLSKQPGWLPGSIGHHGDDGRLFCESGYGFGFGSPWKQNDIIGLGVRPYGGRDVLPGTDVQVFVTHNGREIGHMTYGVPPSGLFPTIGFHSKGEKVKIHHNAKQSNFATQSLLHWRMLVGMKHKYSIKKREEVLSYFNNRRSKKYMHSHAFSIAISSEPFSDKMTYFEVKLLNFGQLRAIGVGATAKNYSPDHFIGWVDGSIAYHTDSGCLHHASGTGRVFGPIAKCGDTIGCGMSISGSHCTVFFTRNGIEVAHRVQSSVPKGGFYPAIGFTTPGDQVSVSFMDTFKPSSLSLEYIVGIMRIQNASYSDHLLTFNTGLSSSPANAQFGVSLNASRNYYRVNVIRIEDNIRIGLAPRDYPLTHGPGMSSYSVAYDICDGAIKGVFGHTVKTAFVPKCKEGDVIGCGISVSEEGNGNNNNQKKTSTYYAFFTLNGTVVHEMELVDLHDDLFPIVGCIPIKKASAVYMDWSLSTFDTPNAL